jgi:hypothetical protein
MLHGSVRIRRDKPGGDKPKVPSDKAAMRIHRHGP